MGLPRVNNVLDADNLDVHSDKLGLPSGKVSSALVLDLDVILRTGIGLDSHGY